MQRRRRCRRPGTAARARAPEPGRADARDRRGHLPQGRQGRPAPGHRPRRLRPHARRAHGDDRADLPRLRGRRPRRGHDRRRPGAGAVPRDRPLPVLQGGRARGGGASERASAERQILVAGVGNAWMRDDGFGGHVAKALDRARAAGRGHRARLRHRRARPRLRGDARLRRAGARRRQPPGRRAGDAVRDRARPGGDRADRRRRGGQPARDGPEDGAALRQDGRRLAGQGGGRRLRAGRRRGDGPRALARGRGARSTGPPSSCVETVDELRTDAAYAESGADARALDLERDRRHGAAPRGRPAGDRGRASRSARCARSCPSSLAFYFEIVARDTALRGRAARARASSRRGCAAATCGREWDPAPPPLAGHERARRPVAARRSAAPPASAPGPRCVRGDELEVESIEVAERRRHEA